MTARAAIRKADAERVILAAKEAGLKICAIQFDSKGGLVVHTQPVAIRGNSWDDAREAASKRHKVQG